MHLGHAHFTVTDGHSGDTSFNAISRHRDHAFFTETFTETAK